MSESSLWRAPAGQVLPDWRRALAGVVFCGAGLITALGAFGPLSPFLDAFGHLRGHAVPAMVFATVAFALPRRALAILAFGALVTYATYGAIAAWSQVPSGARVGEDFKVLSFNTWHANREPGRVQNLIAREKPDVVILVEFGPNKRWLLGRLKADYPFQDGCAERWNCAMVILSRRPWTASGSNSRDLGPSPPMVWADFVTRSGRHLEVIGVHIMRPIDGPRGHYKELGYIARLAKKSQGDVIVAGDFNATPWAGSLGFFAKRSGLSHMGRFLPSWPAGRRGWPQLPLDHMFVSPRLRIAAVRLGAEAGSDHLPLIARITLPSPLR